MLTLFLSWVNDIYNFLNLVHGPYTIPEVFTIKVLFLSLICSRNPRFSWGSLNIYSDSTNNCETTTITRLLLIVLSGLDDGHFSVRTFQPGTDHTPSLDSKTFPRVVIDYSHQVTRSDKHVCYTKHDLWTKEDPSVIKVYTVQPRRMYWSEVIFAPRGSEITRGNQPL